MRRGKGKHGLALSKGTIRDSECAAALGLSSEGKLELDAPK